jgi:hypothetical protein
MRGRRVRCNAMFGGTFLSLAFAREANSARLTLFTATLPGPVVHRGL